MLLAKARRPDFLTPGHVGLDRLTHTLLAKARALTTVTGDWDEAADVIVEGWTSSGSPRPCSSSPTTP